MSLAEDDARLTTLERRILVNSFAMCIESSLGMASLRPAATFLNFVLRCVAQTEDGHLFVVATGVATTLLAQAPPEAASRAVAGHGEALATACRCHFVLAEADVAAMGRVLTAADGAVEGALLPGRTGLEPVSEDVVLVNGTDHEQATHTEGTLYDTPLERAAFLPRKSAADVLIMLMTYTPDTVATRLLPWMESRIVPSSSAAAASTSSRSLADTGLAWRQREGSLEALRYLLAAPPRVRACVPGLNESLQRLFTAAIALASDPNPLIRTAVCACIRDARHWLLGKDAPPGLLAAGVAALAGRIAEPVPVADWRLVSATCADIVGLANSAQFTLLEPAVLPVLLPAFQYAFATHPEPLRRFVSTASSDVIQVP
jgi:hypothetical protein